MHIICIFEIWFSEIATDFSFSAKYCCAYSQNILTSCKSMFLLLQHSSGKHILVWHTSKNLDTAIFRKKMCQNHFVIFVLLQLRTLWCTKGHVGQRIIYVGKDLSEHQVQPCCEHLWCYSLLKMCLAESTSKL